jgi:simple sugar transport system permease protein
MTAGASGGTGAALAAPETLAPATARSPMTPRVVFIYGAIAITLLSIVREISGASDLTSSGTFSAALRLAVPIGLAGLGAIYSERAGVVNIGLEGMMILGTWFGAWAGWLWGAWWGVLAGVIGGALGGLLHALATVTFGVDHVVSGVAINILAAGVARFLSVVAYTGSSGGGATQSPQIKGKIGALNIPFLAGGDLFGWRSPNAFGWLEKRRWFLISDLAGFLRGATGNLSWLTVIAILLVPISVWVLWRTAFGLRLRSVGEHPQAAESLGVAVYAMK